MVDLGFVWGLFRVRLVWGSSKVLRFVEVQLTAPNTANYR